MNTTTRRTVDAPDYRAWAGDGPNAERIYQLRHEHGYLDVMTRFMELVDAADDGYDAEALAAQALAEFTEIRESDLREALEDAAAVNGVADELDIDAAIAHWREHPTGTEGAVAPDDNDGYAVRIVDQIAVGYILADGPWWK